MAHRQRQPGAPHDGGGEARTACRRAELKRLAGLIPCQAGNGAGQPDWFGGKPAGRREISGRDMRQAVADAIGLRRILLVPVPAGGADDGQRLVPERLGAGQAWRRD